MSRYRNCCGKLALFGGPATGCLSSAWMMALGREGSEVMPEADQVHWAHPDVGSAGGKPEPLAT
jgi:hypothetical protein